MGKNKNSSRAGSTRLLSLVRMKEFGSKVLGSVPKFLSKINVESEKEINLQDPQQKFRFDEEMEELVESFAELHLLFIMKCGVNEEEELSSMREINFSEMLTCLWCSSGLPHRNNRLQHFLSVGHWEMVFQVFGGKSTPEFGREFEEWTASVQSKSAKKLCCEHKTATKNVRNKRKREEEIDLNRICANASAGLVEFSEDIPKINEFLSLPNKDKKVPSVPAPVGETNPQAGEPTPYGVLMANQPRHFLHLRPEFPGAVSIIGPTSSATSITQEGSEGRKEAQTNRLTQDDPISDTLFSGSGKWLCWLAVTISEKTVLDEGVCVLDEGVCVLVESVSEKTVLDEGVCVLVEGCHSSRRYRFAAVIGEVIRTWDSLWRVCMKVRQALENYEYVE